MSERVNPYTALKQSCRNWARQVLSPRCIGMWSYPAARLRDGWSLLDLKERVAAADQLGYDVRLRVDGDGGLVVQYVKRPPDPPWEIRP